MEKKLLPEKIWSFLQHHTSLTHDDKAMYENFMVKHPDGNIARKEFRSMVQACYPDIDVIRLEKHIFRLFDKDGDGTIDFKEFMIVLYIMSNGTAEENLRQIFKVFDLDGNGCISREEMTRICHDLSYMITIKDNPNGYNADTLGNMAFQEMDTNHDGWITEEEFITACFAQKQISTMLALKIIDVFMPSEDD